MPHDPQMCADVPAHDRDFHQHVKLTSADFVSGRAHEGVAFRNCDVSGRAIDAATFEDSLLWKVNGSKGKLINLELDDLLVDECDFTNAQWPKAQCTHIVIRKSRFTGLNATEARLRNTLFRECKLNLAVLQDVQLNECVLISAIYVRQTFRALSSTMSYLGDAICGTRGFREPLYVDLIFAVHT